MRSATRAAVRRASRLPNAAFAGSEEVSWGESKIKRIGVPGGTQINIRRSGRFLLCTWRGTAFKSALTSVAAVTHFSIYGALCVCAWYVETEYGDVVHITVYNVAASFVEAFTFLLAFLMAQYLGFVVTRYSERLAICIDTAEAASQVAFQAAVLLRGHKERACQLVRYANLFLHIYYLTIDGPMTVDKWSMLTMRKLCSPSERAILERIGGHHEAANVYIWALDIVHQMTRLEVLSTDHAVRMEDELSECRRQASRQNDYHESPIPMPFFHLMSVMSHAYLMTIEWNSAIRLAVGVGNSDGILVGELIGTIVLITSVNTLRRLALAMTNPFGDDETDYELDYDLRRLWSEAQQTMQRMPEDDQMDQMIAPPPDGKVRHRSASGEHAGRVATPPVDSDSRKAHFADSAARPQPRQPSLGGTGDMNVPLTPLTTMYAL